MFFAVYAAGPTLVWAQAFPDHPIKLFVPAPAGGSADAITRAIGVSLAKDLNATVVVENRSGAGGVVATEAVVRGPADGYMITMVNSSHATNPILLKELPYDTLKDTTAIGYLGYIPLVLVTPPNTPFANLGQVIAQLKAKPGSLDFASGGIGSGGHLAGEMLKNMAGVNMVHVPFQGNAPAVTAVLGGHIPLMFDTISNSLPHIRAGKLKVLAISSPRRSSLLPEVPTVAESGVANFDVSAWIAFIIKAGAPADTVNKLNASFNKALQDPEFRARPALRGVELAGGSVGEANAFMRAEIERWTTVLKEAGVKN